MAGNLYDEALEDLDQTAPPADEFEAAVARIHQGREQRLRASMLESGDTTPDRAAEARTLSLETGLPPRLVEQNFDRVKKEAVQGRTPYEQMFAETPFLAEWASDPENAKLAADDMESLGAIEWLVQAPGRAFARGINQIRAGRLATESIFRELTQEERDQLNSYESGMQEGGQLGAGSSWFRKAVVGGSQQLPNLFGGGLYAAQYGLAGAATVGAVGAGAGIVAGGVGVVPGAIGGAGIGFAAGSRFGAGKFGFELEAGLAYREFLEFKDETGQRLDPTVAKMAAIATGTVNAGLEAVGLGAFAKTIPGLEKLTSVGVRSAVKKALLQPTVRAALFEAAATYGKALTIETATEVAQRAMTILSGELGKAASDANIPRKSGGEILEELADEGVGGIQAFAFTLGAGPAMSVARAHAQVRRGEQAAQYFKALGGQVAASKTAQRMPAAVEEFIAKATENGPIATVYAPADTWVQYWQSKGVDPAAIAEDILGDAGALDRALSTGEDLAIPTSRYAVTLAATEHNAFFAEELRLAPGEMNARESRTYRENLAAERKAEAEVEAREAAIATTPTAREQLAAQFTAAGFDEQAAQQQADLLDSTIGSLAGRVGVEASDLYAEYGITTPEFLQREAIQQEAARPVAPLPSGTHPAEALALEEERVAAKAEVAAEAGVDPVLEAAGLAEGVEAVAGEGQALPAIERAEAGAELAPRISDPDALPVPVPSAVAPALALRDGLVVDINPANQETTEGPDAARQDDARAAGRTGDAGAAGVPSGAQAREPLGAYARPERAAAYTEAVAAARALSPDVDEAGFRAGFDNLLDLYDELLGAQTAESPTTLLKAIAKYGGIYESERGQAGELRRLREGQAFGKVGGVSGVLVTKPRQTVNIRKKIDGKWEIRRERRGGLGLDEMLLSLKQDGSFPWLTDIEQLTDFLDDVQKHGVEGPLAATPDAATIAEIVDTVLRDLAAPANLLSVEAMEADILDPDGPVDTSFNVAEFNQSLFDTIEEPGPVVDMLPAGAQPRLPGDVGAVREEERPTPQEEVPFALTSEVATRGSVQKTLFQSAATVAPAVTVEELDRFVGDAKTHFGEDLARLELTVTEEGDVALEHLAVARGANRAGLGSRVMQALTRWADMHHARIVLNLGETGYGADQGTEVTSSSRDLARFYERHGFRRPTNVDDPLAFWNMSREPTLRVREFSQSFPADNPRLTAIHHTSGEGLVAADKLGGIPMPSLAVRTEGLGAIEGFGDVTLIGTRDMADPSTTAVFDADAYTVRQPRPEYKPAKSKPVQAFISALRETSKEFEDYASLSQIWDQAIDHGQVQENLRTFATSNTVRGWWLRQQGVDIQPVITPKVVEVPFVNTPPFTRFVEEHGGIEQLRRHGFEETDYRKALAQAISAAIDAEWEGLDPTGRSQARAKGTWIDEDGMPPFGYTLRLTRSYEAIGADAVDRWATDQAIKAAFADRPDLAAQFAKWTEDTVLGWHPPPFVTVGRKKLPYTAANILEAMERTGVRGAEKGLTFGEGKARAMLSVRIGDLQEARNRAGSIRSEREVEAAREDTKNRLQQWRDSVIGFYQYPGETWDALDASMKAMARPRVYTARSFRQALSAEGFRNVPDDVVEEGYRARLAMLETPVPYFEAKPARIIQVSEFAGAVVPTTLAANARAVLERAGIPVAEYDPSQGQPARDAATLELTSQLSDVRDDVLFQGEPGDRGRRGAIRFGPGKQVSIRLFERADLSTFLHESGHLFLEIMGDLVNKVSAIDVTARTEQQQQLLSDYATLLGWFGVDSRGAIGVPQHEQFARGFEAYLMEGRAPSIGLQGAFVRFRAWLLGVYRSVSNLGVTLSPDVRAVMDRLVATDLAIAQAEQDRGVPPMFLTAADAGMTAEQFALYASDVAAASRKARERLEVKLLAEVQREQTAQWKARRNEVEAEVAAAVYQEPVYRALAAIQRGTQPDGSPMVEGLETAPLKLSRAILVARYGKDYLKRLPRPYVYTTEGGMDPDQVASLFGFTSGDELLKTVEGAAPMRDVIRARTEQRMLAEHGSMLLDGTLQDQARAAIANEDHDAIIRAELRALAALKRTVTPFLNAAGEQLAQERAERDYERRWLEAEAKLRVEIARGQQQVEIDRLTAEVQDLKAKARGGARIINAAIPSHQTIVDAAKERIAGMKIRAIRPDLFWNASRRAAQQAVERAARQDLDGAIEAKRRELFTLALYREAQRVLEDVDGRVKFAKDLARPTRRATIGQAGHNYLDQIDGVLDRFEFARVSRKALDRRASLVKFLEGLQSAGLPAELPPELVDEALRRNYRDLTVEELVGVTDGLRQLVHLATLKNRLLKAQDQREFDEVRQAVVASIKTHGGTSTLPLEFTGAAERKRRVADWFASHTKISQLAAALDGYIDGGPMWTYVIKPLNDAANAEADRNATEGAGYMKLLRQFYSGAELGAFRRQTFIPAIKASLSKEATLSLALNWGNATSRDRILNDPRRRWDPGQVDAILGTLDRRDWEFVQATWDHIDRFWPEIAAKQERVLGVAPEKVEPLEVRTPFGVFRGGYYPLVYDGRLNIRSQQLEAASEAKTLLQGAYLSSTTKRGHVEARKSHVRLSVRLDLGVVFQHMQQVVHDLTHHEALLDVSRVLRDSSVSSAILEAKGDVVYQQFSRALQDIAAGNVNGPRPTIIDQAARYARHGTQLSLLGLNLWTAAQQPLGIFNGMQRVGVGWVAKGLSRWLRDAASMENTAKWINEVSPFMRNRGGTATQDLSDLRLELKRAGGWFDKLVRTVSGDTLTQSAILDGYLWHIGLMQRVADIPTWLGQYEKSKAAGETEERAIGLADQAVLDAQGGGQIKDLSQVQRGGEVARLFMTFYSYGSTVFNATARIAGQAAWSPVKVLETLGSLALLYTAPAMATVAMRAAFGKDDEEDDEGFVAHVGREMLSTALNTMVGVRELGGLVQEGTRGYAGPAGARILQLVYGLGAQVKQGEADEAFFKAVNAVGGILFRYPAAQLQRTIDGIAALDEGRSSNPLVLLFGAPPKRD